MEEDIVEGQESQATPGADAPEREPQETARRVPQYIRRSGLGTVVTILAAAVILVFYQWVTWPDIPDLAVRNPKTTAFIDGYRESAPPMSLRWQWVAYDEISVHAKRAVVSGEDMGFFSHSGFAYEEIRVAIGEAMRGERELRGASTITQQVAKNLWLSPSRSPLRKIKEAMFTRQLEEHLSKRRILEIYLNVAEFGPGIYGVEAAAARFFDKHASELTEREAAELAASLPRPNRWHPGIEREDYLRYVEEVLRRMEKAEFLWSRVEQ